MTDRDDYYYYRDRAQMCEIQLLESNRARVELENKIENVKNLIRMRSTFPNDLDRQPEFVYHLLNDIAYVVFGWNDEA